MLNQFIEEQEKKFDELFYQKDREVGRAELMRFLNSSYTTLALKVIEEIEDKAFRLRDVYDDDCDFRNDKYRIEGRNAALSDISIALTEIKKQLTNEK